MRYIHQLKVSSVILLVITLSACADLTHFNKQRTFENNSSVYIDAKQRGVYYYTKEKQINEDALKIYNAKIARIEAKVEAKKELTDEERKILDNKGNIVKAKEVFHGFCAEPSPDAISALAATLGVNLNVADEGELALSQAISEGVGNIGVRTVAIQALRDMMYRNCEAYASGGITTFGLETLQRRFQSTMIAILAIEQLTGAVKSPDIIIVSESSAGSPEAILNLTNKAEVARVSLDNSKQAEKEAKEALTTANKEKEVSEEALKTFNAEIVVIEAKVKASTTLTDDEKKKLSSKDNTIKELNKVIAEKNESADIASKTHTSAQKTTHERQQAYDGIEASRVAALTGGGKAKNKSIVKQVKSGQPLPKDSVDKIADTVLKIVGTTTQLNYWVEVCTTLVGQHGNQSPNKGSALDICTGLIRENNKDHKAFFLNASEKYGFPASQKEEAPKVRIIKKSNHIKKLQKLLNQMNFTDDSNNKLEEDNVWGEKTEKILKSLLVKCAPRPSIEVKKENLEKLLNYVGWAKKKGCSANK